MPDTGKTILDLLNTDQRSLESAETFGLLEEGIHTAPKAPALFARIDPKKFAEEMGEQAADLKKENKKVEKQQKKAKKEESKKEKKNESEIKKEAEFSDFEKIELKAGKILSAKRHPKADRLLIEEVDLGNGDVRQIVSGIAEKYTPEEITGKTVLVVSNLKPAKLRGELSSGMILCADSADGYEVIFLPDSIQPGTVLR